MDLEKGLEGFDSFDEEFGGDMLDLNLEDGLSNLDEASLEGFGEVDTNIDKPHFKVTTKDMKDAVNAISKIASTGGRDILTKSISFKVEDGELKLRGTDFDVFVERSITILNNENELEDHVVIPLSLLQRVLKASPTLTVIYKEGEDYFIRLVGGDMILETYKADLAKYKLGVEFTKETTIDAKELNTIIKDLSPIVASAVAPQEKRIIFSEEGAIASYLLALVVGKGSFPMMDLKTKDIQALNTLTNNIEGDLEIYNSESTDVCRKCIKGPNFSYIFLLSDKVEKSPVFDKLEDYKGNVGVHIDTIQIYKMSELAAELSFSAGRVQLEYSDKGAKFTIITKKDKNSEFELEGSMDGKVNKKKVIVQASLLKTLLRVFARCSSVKLSIEESGISLSTDNYKAIIIGESK